MCILALVGVGYFALIVSKCGAWVEKCFEKRFKTLLKRLKIHKEDKPKEKKEDENDDKEETELAEMDMKVKDV